MSPSWLLTQRLISHPWTALGSITRHLSQRTSPYTVKFSQREELAEDESYATLTEPTETTFTPTPDLILTGFPPRTQAFILYLVTVSEAEPTLRRWRAHRCDQASALFSDGHLLVELQRDGTIKKR